MKKLLFSLCIFLNLTLSSIETYHVEGYLALYFSRTCFNLARDFSEYKFFEEYKIDYNEDDIVFESWIGEKKYIDGKIQYISWSHMLNDEKEGHKDLYRFPSHLPLKLIMNDDNTFKKPGDIIQLNLHVKGRDGNLKKVKATLKILPVIKNGFEFTEENLYELIERRKKIEIERLKDLEIKRHKLKIKELDEKLKKSQLHSKL